MTNPAATEVLSVQDRHGRRLPAELGSELSTDVVTASHVVRHGGRTLRSECGSVLTCLRWSDARYDLPPWDGYVLHDGLAVGPEGLTGRGTVFADLGRTPNDEDVRRTLFAHRGIYLLGRFGSDGSASFLTDPFGTYPLFLHLGRDHVVVSNNALLIEHVLRTLGRAPTRTTELFAQDLVVGTGLNRTTGFDEVRWVPIGHEIRLRPGHPVQLRPILDPFVGRTGIGTDADAVLDTAANEVTDNVRAIAEAPFPTRICDLTGGADSRVVLAAILAEGLEDRFAFHCIGAPPGPDYATSAYLQDLLGLTGTRLPAGSAWDDLRADPITTLAAFVHRTMGCSGFFNDLGIGLPHRSDVIQIGGVGGEVYKGIAGPQERPTTRSAAVDHLAGTSWTSRFPITEQARQRLEHEIAAAVDEQAAAGWSDPGDVVDQWYLRNRNRYFSGLSWHLINRHRTQFQPLYSPAAVRAMAALPPDRRGDNRVGFELIRRLYEPLLTLPLAEARWAPSVIAGHPDRDLLAGLLPFTPDSPEVSPSPGRRAHAVPPPADAAGRSPWERRCLRRGLPTWWRPFDRLLPAARDHVLSMPETDDLWTVFDRDGIGALLQRDLADPWRGAEIKTVYRVVIGAIWRAGDERPVHDHGGM